jgi:hypothetical protein
MHSPFVRYKTLATVPNITVECVSIGQEQYILLVNVQVHILYTHHVTERFVRS